jgi:hypothetical protein
LPPELPACQDRRVRRTVRLFNLSVVEKRLGNSTTVTRTIGRLDRPSATLSGLLRVAIYFKRILAVGNGDIDVGKKPLTRKGGQRIVGRLTGRDGAAELRVADPDLRQNEPVKVCGAMSQQYGDGGRDNESAPQKFVHLVGYRDPKARPEPRVRPPVSPVKR